MTYRRRTNIWEGRRYDGSRTCANRIAAENPLVRRDGALLYVPAQDEPDPRRAPIVSPKVGDWIVWEPCTNPVPFVVPATLFRLLFEEDLTSKALRPGAAEARRAGMTVIDEVAPRLTEAQYKALDEYVDADPVVPGPRINIPREPAGPPLALEKPADAAQAAALARNTARPLARRVAGRPKAAATPPVRGGKNKGKGK